MRCRDIVDRMALRSCSRPNADRIAPLALTRLSALGMAIQHAGAAKEWEATEYGRDLWIGYRNSVALELAAV